MNNTRTITPMLKTKIRKDIYSDEKQQANYSRKQLKKANKLAIKTARTAKQALFVA